MHLPAPTDPYARSICYFFTPSFLKPALNQIGNGFWESFALPASTFIQQSVFVAFEISDTVVRNIPPQSKSIDG